MTRTELMCPACLRDWTEGKPVHLEPSPGLAPEGYFVADECDHWPTSDLECGEDLARQLNTAIGKLTGVMERMGQGERRGLRADVSEARVLLDEIESWSGKVGAFNKPVPVPG